MDIGNVLLIAIPVLLSLAVLLVVATTVSRQRASTGSLGREARKADRSASAEVVPATNLDDEARARFAATKQSLEPAGGKPAVSAAGGLIRFGEAPADPDQISVTRRQFFNRSILATQSLVLGSFGLAVIAFLWPSLSGGFGSKVRAGTLEEILGEIAEKKEPYYVPEARSYVVPYPTSAVPAGKKVYAESVLPGLEAGVVALFQ
jgi:cytochrome b6-f complex iron-sulfur subunit